LAAETKGTYFPKILRRDTSFYLLGWTPGTYDSHNPLNALMAHAQRQGRRAVQPGLVQQASVSTTHRRIQSETDPPSATR
jgi:peptide/nickel transport system substrate-binding protein